MKKQLKNKKVLIALISVCIVLAAALSVFIYYKTGLKAVSSRETPTSFQVQPGETSEADMAVSFNHPTPPAWRSGW